MPDVHSLTAANRINIPAICRIPGRGTAVLISPGLLLTSSKALSKSDASRATAVFFEGSKKDVVEVSLKPNELYFSASYPEHLDYCIVACETSKIFNVAPVKLPLVSKEWSTVKEDDVLLVVQHPVSPDAEQPQTEVKRFDEVLRRREDLYYLPPFPDVTSHVTTAGCPAFNDMGTFVGLQSQQWVEGEGAVSRVVSVVTIVKHLFANAMLNRINQTPLFDDVWDTWYVTGETTRAIAILANFKHPEVAKETSRRLCEMTSNPDSVSGIVASGGTKVIIDSINQFRNDEDHVAMGMRSLWNVSFSKEDNRRHIIEAQGIQVVTNAMNKYASNVDIAQFGCVILFNLTMSKEAVGDWCIGAVDTVLTAMLQTPDIEVVQKFGIGFLMNVSKIDAAYSKKVLEVSGVDHAIHATAKCPKNEYMAEHSVVLIATIAMRPEFQFHHSLVGAVPSVIEAMKKFPSNNNISLYGNHALWGMGQNPKARLAILHHADGPSVLVASAATVSAVM